MLFNIIFAGIVSCSIDTYFSGFVQPLPPLLPDSYSANFMQHKWNNISMTHISSGVIYSSYDKKRVRVDASFKPGNILSSLFDYNNVTDEGYLNRVNLNGKIDHYRSFNNAFPLIYKNILRENNAVYTGKVIDELHGQVEKWNTISDNVSVDFFIKDNIFVRYDFALAHNRTFTTTRFFNIENTELDVFNLDF